jgi:hypothetical protein
VLELRRVALGHVARGAVYAKLARLFALGAHVLTQPARVTGLGDDAELVHHALAAQDAGERRLHVRTVPLVHDAPQTVVTELALVEACDAVERARHPVREQSSILHARHVAVVVGQLAQDAEALLALAQLGERGRRRLALTREPRGG